MNSSAIASSGNLSVPSVGTKLRLYGGLRGEMTAAGIPILPRQPVIRWFAEAMSTSPVVVYPSVNIASNRYSNTDPVKDLENLFSEIDALGESVSVMSYDEWRTFRSDEDKRLNDLYGFED